MVSLRDSHAATSTQKFSQRVTRLAAQHVCSTCQAQEFRCKSIPRSDSHSEVLANMEPWWLNTDSQVRGEHTYTPMKIRSTGVPSPQCRNSNAYVNDEQRMLAWSLIIASGPATERISLGVACRGSVLSKMIPTCTAFEKALLLSTQDGSEFSEANSKGLTEV